MGITSLLANPMEPQLLYCYSPTNQNLIFCHSPKWKTTNMEDDQNGRRPKWKTTKIEDDQNGRRPKWKTTKMEDDQNGRQPKWKKLMCCLTSNATKFLNLNDVFTTKTSTL